MKYCANCATPIEEGIKFCAKCGADAAAALSAPPAAPPAAAPPPMAAPQPQNYAPRPPSALGVGIKQSFNDIFKNAEINIWVRGLKLFAWIGLFISVLFGFIVSIRANMEQVRVERVWGAEWVDRLNVGNFFQAIIPILTSAFVMFFVLLVLAEIAKNTKK
jgi:hypothetical protein